MQFMKDELNLWTDYLYVILLTEMYTCIQVLELPVNRPRRLLGQSMKAIIGQIKSQLFIWRRKKNKFCCLKDSNLQMK